ncbi:hypothetical protein T492DRAFT_254089 [Pavlovales sp. CCMP2436]|nr:hypothetical protein T492DRAFT_254089 [Pavlovales sp. CCMP2436]
MVLASVAAIDGFEEGMVARLQRQLELERSTNVTLRTQLRLAHSQSLAQQVELVRLRADDRAGRALSEGDRKAEQADMRLEKVRRAASETDTTNRELAARVATLERLARDGDARHAALAKAHNGKAAEAGRLLALLKETQAALEATRAQAVDAGS